METNETYTHKPEYSQKTVTSQTGGSNADTLAQFEQLKNMLCGELIDENNALKKENEELKANCQKKDETIVSQAEDINEYKKKLEQAQEIIKSLEKCYGSGYPPPMYKYEYNLCDFSEKANIEDIDYLFDCLLYLTEVMIKPEKYLINTISNIVALYQVLSRDENLVNTKYHFTGTLKNFCDYWNINIVPNIKDRERAEKLTFKYESVKTEINKTHWKNVGPGSWRRLAMEPSKKKKIYEQAFNIKERTVKLITNKHRA